MSDVLTKVLAIPKAFLARGNETLAQLLLETGYVANRDIVTVVSVTEAIARDPSIVDAWRFYSENKRVSQGWYIVDANEGGAYEVGSLPAGPKLLYNDLINACAEFIVREVEAIAQSANP